MEEMIFQPLLLPQIKNEKTTVDLREYKICHLLQSKSVTKDRKVTKKRLKEGKIKPNNQKDREDKIISTLPDLFVRINTMASVNSLPVEVRALSGRTYAQRIPVWRVNS